MSLSLNYLSDQMQEPYQQMEDNTLLACLFGILHWNGEVGAENALCQSLYTYEGDVILPSGCHLQIWTAIVLLFVQL